MQYQSEFYSRIKLIIWDLDETFWNGTLSEGAVTCPEKNKELLRLTTETGIVNSICSKNDETVTKAELSELGVLDYFVFPSINWNPKGERIRHIIEEMQLRASNVLFLDDNHLNVAEAEFFCPEIMTAGPEVIDDLIRCSKTQYDSGKRQNRIPQYRILERKYTEREDFGSNEDFLLSSQIHVDINEDCSDQAERICGLNKRANQLNFTKNRVELPEIQRALNDPDYRCGTVAVSDRFGDYGVTGFFCVDMRANRLEHFFFSCRTMGMGVEQYVYRMLGRPKLTIVGEISSDPNVPDNPFWINQGSVAAPKAAFSLEKKILFKGPCDLWSVCNFFDDGAIIPEFTYDMEKNGAIDYGLNHTVTMLNAALLSKDEQEQMEQDLPFIGERTFRTQLFSGTCQVVLLSVLMDAMLACYRNKTTGRVIVWGDWCLDITDPRNWDALIAGTVETYGMKFGRAFLEQFSQQWTYEGQLSVGETVKNFVQIRKLLPKETVLILILGSEIAYEKNTLPAYDGREEYNRKLNRALEAAFAGMANTYLLNTTDLITSQSDFNDRITHLTKPTYYRMASEINRILEQKALGMHQKSKVYALFAAVRQKLWKNAVVRKIYYGLRRQK